MTLTHIRLWPLSFALLLTGCATAPTPQRDDHRTDANASKARYWAIQKAQKPAQISSDFEILPLTRPERTENGVIRNPSTDYICVPHHP